MAFEDRLARLLRVIVLLQGKAVRNVRDLAADLEMSERTVYRDLNALSAAGVPVSFDREDGSYRITGDFFLPPVNLTLTEAMALSVMGSQVAGRSQLPFLAEAAPAVAKVRSQLPASLREEVAGLDGHVQIHEARVSPQVGCEGHFRTIQHAIANRRKVLCKYPDAKDPDDQPFLFRPYSLFFGQRAWYAIGHSERRNAERTLKLNRLVEATATDLPYMIPDDWSVESTFGHAWRMMKGDCRYAVVIRFDVEFARNVSDTLWHPTQSINWEADGSCVFRCSVDGLDEIVWWVLGYGHHAFVEEPLALRELIITLSAKTNAAYREADDIISTGMIV
jgi:predicted DNA-binding transcriptional regulator YafY